jgi:cyclopropane fatty-acyl-phospholipid synthase-like methyltransferase
MGLKTHHTFLDIGCGPLSAGLLLIPYLQPGNYVGIDIRKEPIAEAHIQIAKADLAEKNPLLIVSNTFGRHELGVRKFDYIWASHVLYHMNNECIDACLKQVSTYMEPHSKFYADVISDSSMVTPERRWFEFSFFVHSTNFLETLGRKYGWEMINLGKIEDHGYPVDWGLKTNNMLEFRSTDAVV